MRRWIRREAGGISPVLLVCLTVVVVGGATFLGLSNRHDNQTTNNNDVVTASLNTQVQSLQTQLAADDARAKTLQDQLSQANADGAGLQGQLSTANSQITSLTQEVASLRSQVATLDSTIASSESKTAAIPGLNNQIANLTDLLAQANKTIDSLKSSPNLTSSTTELDAVAISQPAGTMSPINYINAQFTGYLEISGTASAVSAYFEVNDSFSGYPYNQTTYLFGTGGTLIVPVLPGGITIYFGNYEAANTPVSATITLKYFY